MPGDLHNHSTCSDGSVPIHRLPLMAARAGLDTMAISDHDTLLSVNYCYEHPVQDGVRLLPATELTGYDHEHKHRVHLLCYFPDPESRELKEHCDILRQRRNECGLQSSKGDRSAVPAVPHGTGAGIRKGQRCAVQKRHYGALHQLGCAMLCIGKLYSYLFGWEPRGVVLHQVKYPSVQEVIATAKAAGAVLVFAHPTVTRACRWCVSLPKRASSMALRWSTPATARRTGPSVLLCVSSMG